MKRLSSTILFAGILLLLGTAAIFAWPEAGGEKVTADPLQQAGAAASAQNQQTATTKYNAIAMSLDATSTITNAQALGDAITGTQLILKWDENAQGFQTWIHTLEIGDNFATSVGTAYFIEVDSSAPSAFTLVGDVPPQTGQPGAVQFNLIGDPTCKYNFISIPLEKSSTIATASDLAADIGNVELVLGWDSTAQGYETYLAVPNIGDFNVNVGYPYWVCMNASKTWPN